MTFRKGDTIKVKSSDEMGVVTKVDGESITYQTAWREKKTANEADLEANTGFSAFVNKETPDLMEVLANSASFSVINRISGTGFMSRENFKFLILDSLYEFVVKGWTRPSLETMIPVAALSGKDMDAWFSSQDIYDALVKSIPIGGLDLLYDLIMSKKIGMKSLWFLLKSTGAMTVANVGQRYLQKKGPSYRPQ